MVRCVVNCSIHLFLIIQFIYQIDVDMVLCASTMQNFGTCTHSTRDRRGMTRVKREAPREKRDLSRENGLLNF